LHSGPSITATITFSTLFTSKSDSSLNSPMSPTDSYFFSSTASGFSATSESYFSTNFKTAAASKAASLASYLTFFS
jgi:hypothetical protein